MSRVFIHASLNKNLLYVCAPICIPGICCSKSGCFRFGAITNNAAGNILARFLCGHVFSLLLGADLEELLGPTITGNLTLHSPSGLFPKGTYTILASHWHCLRVLIFPHPRYACYYLFLILVGDKWYLTLFCYFGKKSKPSTYIV